MGTNYYARSKPCEKCGRSDNEIHIGKSSMGWTFTFHATENIKSYKDWINMLSFGNIRIFDEYDKELTLKEFKAMVESKKNEPHNHAKEYPKESYLDDEGHSMSQNEFS